MSGLYCFKLSGHLLFNCWSFPTICSSEAFGYRCVRIGYYGKTFFYSSSNVLEVGAVYIFVLVLFLCLLSRHQKGQIINTVQNQKRMTPNFELTKQLRDLAFTFICLYLPMLLCEEQESSEWFHKLLFLFSWYRCVCIIYQDVEYKWKRLI